MERNINKIYEVKEFINRQSARISATVAGGGLATAPFLDGRLDKVVGTVGAAAFCYTAIRVYRRFAANRDSGENTENE